MFLTCYGLHSHQIPPLIDSTLHYNHQNTKWLKAFGSHIQYSSETIGFYTCIISFWQQECVVALSFLKSTLCHQSAVGAMTNGRRSLWTTPHGAQVWTEKHLLTDVSLWLWSSRFWWPGHRPVLVWHQHMQIWWGVSKNWEHGDMHLRLQGKWCFCFLVLLPVPFHFILRYRGWVYPFCQL